MSSTQISNSLSLIAAKPVEFYAVFSSTANRTAFLSNPYKYDGLVSYDQQEKKLYVLKNTEGSTWIWEEVGAGGGGAGAGTVVVEGNIEDDGFFDVLDAIVDKSFLSKGVQVYVVNNSQSGNQSFNELWLYLGDDETGAGTVENWQKLSPDVKAQAHIANTSNPHNVTKSQIGLNNVTNDAQLKIASNLSDLANFSTARANLGLVKPVSGNADAGTGNSDAQLVLGNDTRLANNEKTTNRVNNLSSVLSETNQYPTAFSVKTYVDSAVVGLLDDRGNYNPTITQDFPITGGSGPSGAILKGDIWIISHSGTITGAPDVVLEPGDQIRALVDSPGQTVANWAISQANIGYVPENAANKSTSTSLGTSNDLYPTQNAVKTYVDTVAAAKQDSLVNQTNIKSINNVSLLGAGNIAILRPNLGIGIAVPSVMRYFIDLNTNESYKIRRIHIRKVGGAGNSLTATVQINETSVQNGNVSVTNENTIASSVVLTDGNSNNRSVTTGQRISIDVTGSVTGVTMLNITIETE